MPTTQRGATHISLVGDRCARRHHDAAAVQALNKVESMTSPELFRVAGLAV